MSSSSLLFIVIVATVSLGAVGVLAQFAPATRCSSGGTERRWLASAGPATRARRGVARDPKAC